MTVLAVCGARASLSGWVQSRLPGPNGARSGLFVDGGETDDPRSGVGSHHRREL